MKQTIFTLVLILSLLPIGAVYHKLGEFDTPGTAEDIQKVGNIAYIADGDSGLVLINIANPLNPNLLGTYNTLGYANYVTVVNNIAYVAEGDFGDGYRGLQIIDVSNSHNPVLISSIDTVGLANSVAVEGNTAYVDNRAAGLQIIDVSNLQNPILLGSYDTPGSSLHVAVRDSIAYLTFLSTNTSGLLIIDATNPLNPTLMGSYITQSSNLEANSFYIVYNAAYIAYSADLRIIDITNPQNPTLIGSYDTMGGAKSVVVIGNTAYVATNWAGLQVIDVSNPQNPILLGSYETPDAANDVAVVWHTAYVADSGSGLQVIDVSNPQNSTLIGSFQCDAWSVTLQDTIAYVVDGGLRIIDISNPQTPAQLGYFYYPYIGGVSSASVSGSIACLSAGGGLGHIPPVLDIIDVSDPQNLFSIGGYDTPGGVVSTTIVGSYAYVADGSSGLAVLDISNPESPTLLGSCDTPGTAYSVYIAGNTAYVVDYGSGLQIIDISNLQNPILLGFYDTPGSAIDVAVFPNVTVGNTAFVADGYAGLQVIDVTNPAAPSLLQTILPHNSSKISDCLVSGNRLYFSDTNWNEISVYDISNPQSPVPNNRYAWNLSTNNLFDVGGLLYTANGAYGLNILDTATFPVDANDAVQYPVTAFQMRNYPNPFSFETSISYTVPVKGQVCLEIYNSKGQLVRQLVDEQQAKGEHSLTWNGKDNSGQSVASGLYLCRITSVGQHESRKLLLLK
jgi:hypothetical protein